MTATITPARPGYGSVFANPEYRALWAAQLASIAGDQFARVALTVLVYDRTRSALLAAVTFAAGILPAAAGGLLLGWVADRWPRRTVMIVSDVICLGLVAAMTVPGLPVPALVGLLFLAGLAASPFASARAATNREVLGPDRFQLGMAVTSTTYQAGELAGFAAAGVTVAVAGVTGALWIDAGSFAASAVLVGFGVRRRRAPETARRRPQLLAGARIVFRSRQARTAALTGWLAAFLIVPDGVAAALAREFGGGAATVGLLLTATTAGMAAGALGWTRLVPEPARVRWTAALAMFACGTLGLFVLSPGLPAACGLLAVSGAAGSGFVVTAMGVFASAVPDADRGKAFGLANAGIMAGQGAAIVVAGWAATRWEPSAVIAAAGGIGAVCAAWAAAPWRDATRPVSR